MTTKLPQKFVWRMVLSMMTTFTIAQSHAEEQMPAINGIDHLLYATSDLQRGMDEIEDLMGVRPVKGGHHPQYGTHNALLSLGPGIYLEVIARDPDLESPARGTLINVPKVASSRLSTWAYRVADIQGSSRALKDAGVFTGPIDSGTRKTPDGGEISWELTDPYATPFNGAIPFLINWGNTVHPSAVIPVAGQLIELTVVHPEANMVRNILSILGADVKVRDGDQFQLSAKIVTERGIVIIR